VVGAPHELLGEVIHAFTVLRPNANTSSEAIQMHCRKRLPAYKTPHQVTILSSMPHNGAGKILKTKLREIAGRTQPIPAQGLDRVTPALSIG
jgi:long-chain acyl-CoA synthetase